MRILYVGSLGSTDSSNHRRMAMERLGHDVDVFDTAVYTGAGTPLARSLRGYTLIGPTIDRFNRDLFERAEHRLPAIIWFDKASYLKPRTLKRLRSLGIYTVHFNIDNPFGPRNDPGWRLILACVPEFDLHLVQRDINLSDYPAAGAKDVRIMRTAFEPTLHYPPPNDWSDSDRLHEVSFIGTPYDNRSEFLAKLYTDFGIRVNIWGGLWDNVLSKELRWELLQGGPIYNDSYRETIWRSRICLSFITHSNCDDVAHRSFEITASGGFMLAEDTPGHRAHFRANEEAVFFSSVEECARAIKQYLPDETARTRIAQAGCRRAYSSDYSNDGRIREALDYVKRQLADRTPTNPGRRAG